MRQNGDNIGTQQEADLAVVRALVDLVPQNWTKAELDVSQKFHRNGAASIAHMIRNPDGLRGAIEPSDELYEATRRLTLAAQRRGHRLKRAHYLVELTADQDWTFRARYEYY
jgi:hypothetical protein